MAENKSTKDCRLTEKVDLIFLFTKRWGFQPLSSLHFLKEKNIPLVILSSGGLGKEAISLYLKKENKLYDNMHIVSNEFIWDERGYAKQIKKPIIHIMNKDETSLVAFDFYDSIKDRKNVILIGDSLGDIGMIKGFQYENLIKIGFLNEKIEENLEAYEKAFDVVISGDGSFEFVNTFLREIAP